MSRTINSKETLRLIVRVAIFGSLSIILYMVPGLQFSVPFAPAFLKIHLDEIPILLSGFAYGWPTALAIIILKSLFRLIIDIPTNMGVGVLSDFIYGIALCIPAVLIYGKKRNIKGALIGISIGLLTNLLFSCIFGLYVIFPLYGYIYGNQTIINMFKIFDNRIDSIVDLRISYEFLLPFNLLKNGIVILSTFLVYKPMRILIQKIKK